jgi:PIN domain nuclease of toxin-antitoxin system
MRLLLDTHYVLALLRPELVERYPELTDILGEQHTARASVVSLWEIAIKTRLGKLDPGLPLREIADFLFEVGVEILSLETRHAVGDVDAEPRTRDPFDRLLLVQCQVEGLRLVTVDRALADHPLNWRGWEN